MPSISATPREYIEFRSRMDGQVHKVLHHAPATDEVFGIANRMDGPKNIFELIDFTIREQIKYSTSSIGTMDPMTGIITIGKNNNESTGHNSRIGRTYNEMGWSIERTNSTGFR